MMPSIGIVSMVGGRFGSVREYDRFRRSRVERSPCKKKLVAQRAKNGPISARGTSGSVWGTCIPSGFGIPKTTRITLRTELLSVLRASSATATPPGRESDSTSPAISSAKSRPISSMNASFSTSLPFMSKSSSSGCGVDPSYSRRFGAMTRTPFEGPRAAKDWKVPGRRSSYSRSSPDC
ncbi:unnamed protein product [Mycena citricolor]|uniref:Uncharacterized protein n=1 Tax=Mycena citricolor TaxID=2018698 RepID=A0AAD2HLW9_9AGAR|nr:unnamed protein product [Mycena citricolor]